MKFKILKKRHTRRNLYSTYLHYWMQSTREKRRPNLYIRRPIAAWHQCLLSFEASGHLPVADLEGSQLQIMQSLTFMLANAKF